MNFGQSIAIHNGKCTAALCPKSRVWLAISSPRAVVKCVKAGQVYLWDVWAGGEPTRDIAETFHGGNDDARYGQGLVAVRAKENGGVFLILGKRAKLPVSDGAVARPAETGFAQLRFNNCRAPNWSSWVRTLSPNTAGDMRPGKL